MSDVPLLTSMLVCGILLSLKEPWAGLSAMIDKLVLSSTAIESQEQLNSILSILITMKELRYMLKIHCCISLSNRKMKGVCLLI